ncbi:MAG: TVP38/TMEM64 family protein [Thermodesulfobacteriota bacterium]
MSRGGVKFLILIAIVASLFLGVKFFGLEEYLDQERLRAWIDGFGAWGPVVYVAFYCVAPALMMPGLPLTVLGGVLFGPVWGVVYVTIGANIGATVAFLISRYMGREWVEGRMEKSSRWQELDRDVEKKGWKIVAFTRLIPLFPFNFLNYAFGLTSIRLSHYVLASLVFMLPGITAYVVFSSSFLDLLKGKVSKEFLIGVTLVVIVSLIPILYKRFKGGKGGG